MTKVQNRSQKYHDGIPALVRSLVGRSDCGLTDEEVAGVCEVSVRTIHRWKKDHPGFLKALIETKAIMDAKVELSLFRRATGYRYNEIEVFLDRTPEGKNVETRRVEKEKEVLPDVGACRLWLTNRDAQNWKDKQDLNISGGISVHFDKEDEGL